MSVAALSVGVSRCVGTIGLNAADPPSNVRLLGVKRTWRALVNRSEKIVASGDPGWKLLLRKFRMSL